LRGNRNAKAQLAADRRRSTRVENNDLAAVSAFIGGKIAFSKG